MHTNVFNLLHVTITRICDQNYILLGFDQRLNHHQFRGLNICIQIYSLNPISTFWLRHLAIKVLYCLRLSRHTHTFDAFLTLANAKYLCIWLCTHKKFELTPFSHSDEAQIGQSLQIDQLWCYCWQMTRCQDVATTPRQFTNAASVVVVAKCCCFLFPHYFSICRQWFPLLTTPMVSCT